MTDLICYDEHTNRYFKTTDEHLKAVEKHIFDDQPVSLEEFLKWLGIEKNVQNEEGIKN